MKTLLRSHADFQPSETTTQTITPPTSEAMTTLVKRLSELRGSYLDELKAARERVKQNFLK